MAVVEAPDAKTLAARALAEAYQRGKRDGQRELLREFRRGGAFSTARAHRLANRAENRLDEEDR